MRIKQILETTTAGSVATVAQPMMTQTRENTNVRGLKPVQQVMKGKAVKKGPYANSITESRVTEDDLAEQDLIVIPGQGRLRRTGFVKHDMDQGEHEGHTLKNSLHTIARAASELDERLSTQSEFPEWVSEKIGAAKGMMVSVMDYLVSSQEMQHGAMESASGLAYEDSDGGEQMLEMAMGELRNIAKNCKQIHQMLKQGKQLDTWEYSYITVSNDHIGTVADVLATDNSDDEQLNEYTPLSGDLGVYLAAAAAAGKVGQAAYEWAKQKWKEHQQNKSMPRQGVAEGETSTPAIYVKGGGKYPGMTIAPKGWTRITDIKDEGDSYFVMVGNDGDGLNIPKDKVSPHQIKLKNGMPITAKQAFMMFNGWTPDRGQGVAEAFDLGDLRKAAASTRSPEDTQALKRNPDFAKVMQKSVDKHNKAVVKTKKDIGSRVADIGPGGKEYNVKTDAAWDAAKKSVEEGWKSKIGAAALAGAAALGGGAAHASEIQPIVAQITFQVDGKTITKDINLGTEYNSPGQASEAVKDFMKSKGIKFYNFKLHRADVQPPLVSKDEMDASNQEYQRQQDSNNLSTTPYSAKGDQSARLQTDKGYTSSSRPGASIAYESKKTVTKNKKA